MNELNNIKILVYKNAYTDEFEGIVKNNDKKSIIINGDLLKDLGNAIKDAGLYDTNIVMYEEGKQYPEFFGEDIKLLEEFNNRVPTKAKQTIAGFLAVGILGGLYGYSQSKVPVEATIGTTKIVSMNETERNNDEASTIDVESMTFDEYLATSTSTKQREVVSMMSNYIDYFNIDFANTYRDNEKDIKPALSWEYEVPALTIAYNDYSKEEIREIFNGAEFSAEELDASYKNAILQLFGAYVISDINKPVRLYDLIESAEGKAFIQKYENMFYSIKEAQTEQEKIERVNAFYAELYKDYPIDDDIREVGISHADARAMLKESYKRAVIPMVTATEVMYQNLAIDHTLSDKAIAYFNDLGLCSDAMLAFQKAENSLLCADREESIACFKLLSKKKVEELKARNAYVIDDYHRDLSRLDLFQAYVNWHFGYNEDKCFDGSMYHINTIGGNAVVTSKKVTTWTETKTKVFTKTTTWSTNDFKDVVNAVGYEAAVKARSEVDAKFAEENRIAEAEANKKADAEQARLQAIEDAKAAKLEGEAAAANKEVEDSIKFINEALDKGMTVNVDNISENIHIDEKYLDDKGNISGIENITKDPTGVNQPLSDPQKAGEEFDKNTRPTDEGWEEHTQYETIEVVTDNGSTEEIIGYIVVPVKDKDKDKEHCNDETHTNTNTSTETHTNTSTETHTNTSTETHTNSSTSSSSSTTNNNNETTTNQNNNQPSTTTTTEPVEEEVNTGNDYDEEVVGYEEQEQTTTQEQEQTTTNNEPVTTVQPTHKDDNVVYFDNYANDEFEIIADTNTNDYSETVETQGRSLTR